MGKPDFVLDLVRSLSKPEKRYFTLFASRYKQESQKKYLRIFRAFDKTKSSKPSELSARLKEERYAGHLAGDKHYLSEMLMSSLRQLHEGSTIQLRLGSEMLSIELLRNKGLLEHALRKIQRVRKEAQEYEFLDILLQALYMEQEIRYNADFDWAEQAPLLLAEISSVLEKMQVLNRLERDRLELLHVAKKKGRPQSEEERAEWNRHIQRFNPEECHTDLFSEKSLRQRLQAYILFVIRDSERADQINRQRYELFQAHPVQIEKAPMEYVMFLFFHSWTSTQSGNYTRAAQLLNELRTLRKTYDETVFPAVCRLIDNRLLSTEIYVYGKTEQYDRIRELEPEAEQFFRRMAPGLKGSFIFNMATTFLLAGDFRKVIQWSHRTTTSKVVQKDYVTFTTNRFMQIIAHIELEDTDVAMSLAGATQRYIEQRKGERGIDTEFIALLRKCAAVDDKMLRGEYVKEFLEKNGAHPVFSKAEEFYPLRVWVSRQADAHARSAKPKTRRESEVAH